MDTSKEGLGVVLPRNKQMGVITWWPMAAHEKNYHSTKLEFLALKWAITEYFKEYLLYHC